jgi:LAO/AO transport system kinase
MIIEILEVIKSAGFTKIIIETVGVGQNEIEIAGIADITLVVLVPESGDDIQSMKAGLMEIADVFIVNKSDRPGADTLYNNLINIQNITGMNIEIPVFKTIASAKKGIDGIAELLKSVQVSAKNTERKSLLITEKIYRLIQKEKMKNVFKEDLLSIVKKENKPINIFKFTRDFLNKK